MDRPVRKANRLKNFDYNNCGAYFITICTQDRECILGQIVGGSALDAPQMKLSHAGEIVEKYILSSRNIKNIELDNFVIMPNHIHLLIRVDGIGTSRASSPTRATEDCLENGGLSKAPAPTNKIIPHFVSTLKRFVNRDLGENIFQRSYHDHVVRGRLDYEEIWEYIENNPLKWKLDKLYRD